MDHETVPEDSTIDLLKHQVASLELRLEEAERRASEYELLSNNSRDIILFIDLSSGHLIETNLAASKAYGYSHDELLKQSIHDLRAPDTHNLTATQMAKADTEGILFETVHVRKDGSTFPVEVSSRGATIGGERTLISVVRDISERKAIEETLQSLARFPDENPFPVLRISINGEILYANTASKDLLHSWGCSENGSAPGFVQEIVRKSLETNSLQRIELSIGTRIYSLTFAPIRESQYVNVYGAEITDQIEAEKALRRSEAVLAQAGHMANLGAWEIEFFDQGDVNANPLHWSEEVYRIFGYEPDEIEVTNQLFFEHVRPDDRQKLTDAVALALSEKRPYEIEHLIIRPDGRERTVLEHAEIKFDGDGRPVLMVGAVQDITERKRAEEALRDYSERLERSNRELQEFAFVASHDLQEPLRKIAAFGNALLTNSDNLSERQCGFLDRMRAAADRMQAMIDDLLSLSRISTQGQPYVSVELFQIVAGIISDLELQVERTGGRLEIGDLPVVEADPSQMRQLMQNLIGNALKYHRPGVPPVVKVSSQLISPAQVQILIEDNGIGFDEKYVDRIFQPFQRLVGRSEYEGTGIGLAICKKIVERHGGEITARSILGKGSTFIVTLPINSLP